jgi:hypothetical protein
MRRARALVAERDGILCRRGDGPIDMSLSGMHPDGPNLGHIIPASQGGTDDLANLGLEHRRCNLAAGPRLTPPRAAIATPIRSVS